MYRDTNTATLAAMALYRLELMIDSDKHTDDMKKFMMLTRKHVTMVPEVMKIVDLSEVVRIPSVLSELIMVFEALNHNLCVSDKQYGLFSPSEYSLVTGTVLKYLKSCWECDRCGYVCCGDSYRTYNREEICNDCRDGKSNRVIGERPGDDKGEVFF